MKYKRGSRLFQAEPLDEVMQGLTHHGVEDSMEMERRKVGNLGQYFEGHALIEVGFDVVQNSVGPGGVFFLHVVTGSAWPDSEWAI